ncbi:MAG: metal-dependent hydrolase [Rhodocyclaceae bacterium]|nr:metal-dependent hydrolase [Rhodocyclaceae bacterium]MBX3667208.1 metal-dependent hydrolase [Rhodocyclaceae bacterium]
MDHLRPSAEIITRRVDLQFDPSRGSGWIPDEPATELLTNTLSLMFPAGEGFFIESVQHYQGQIVDPQLREDLRRFVYQEAMHMAQHGHCNRALCASHPGAAQVGRIAGFFLGAARRFGTRKFRLAVTCALEHFTAMLADHLLGDLEKFGSNGRAEFVQLWAWHAVEETEHKGVCFDVYESVAGKGVWAYLVRSWAMILTTLGLGAAIGIGALHMRPRKSSAPAPAAARQAGQRGHGTALQLLRRIVPWRLYLSYYSPSFHPWNHDNRHLIEAWKVRYPAFGSAPGASNRPDRAAGT